MAVIARGTKIASPDPPLTTICTAYASPPFLPLAEIIDGAGVAHPMSLEGALEHSDWSWPLRRLGQDLTQP
jgi:hypothetical protein